MKQIFFVTLLICFAASLFSQDHVKYMEFIEAQTGAKAIGEVKLVHATIVETRTQMVTIYENPVTKQVYVDGYCYPRPAGTPSNWVIVINHSFKVFKAPNGVYVPKNGEFITTNYHGRLFYDVELYGYELVSEYWFFRKQGLIKIDGELWPISKNP